MIDALDLLDLEPRGPIVEFTVTTFRFRVPFRTTVDDLVPRGRIMAAGEFRRYLRAKYVELFGECREKRGRAIDSQESAS